MAQKLKTMWHCQSCGAQSPKWLGKCPYCHAWNTYVEEVIAREPAPGLAPSIKQNSGKPLLLSQIDAQQLPRVSTLDNEFDRVLGGGIVPGSVVLLGGEPGIGKSTLLLQLILNLNSLKVLYVSGEESEQQIKMRAERIAGHMEHAYILTETDTQNIFKQIELLQPQLVIIDSIQTMQSGHLDSSAGSVSQVRECTAEFIKFAKQSHVPVIMVGHITKEGVLAGPKVLEHMVDTVLQFEGDRHLAYRIMRTTKNRFGSTAELGIYEMQGGGLRQVSNPSEVLISQHPANLSGIAIAATIEGNRPLLIEIQSLVSPTSYGTPQRSATGFDNKRLQMLLAVLEKRGGYKLGQQDVFLNVAGGLKIEDPAVDLAVCASIISSYEDLPVGKGVVFAAEVGLGGEVRSINRPDNRMAEAGKLGYKTMVLSQYAEKAVAGTRGIKAHYITRVHEVYDLLQQP